MNYYEHHLGDYMRDTAHLSMLEDGAYRRLLDTYYIKELPIPLEQRDVYRLTRAQSKQEREAVKVVLEEFFERTPAGWKHKRCDAEIARFQEKRSKAQRSAEARWGALRTQPKDDANASPPDDANAMRPQCEGNAPTHHTPHTNHQTPDIEDTRSLPEQPSRVSMAGAVCVALRAEGVGSVNPGHPELPALLDRGAEVQNFVAAARSAKKKTFPYILGIVRSQLEEACQIAAMARTTTGHLNGSSGGAARAARAAEAVPNLVARRAPAGDVIDTETRDVTPPALG